MQNAALENKTLFCQLTFSLVPLAPVESALSLPARSTRLILLTYNRIRKNRMENKHEHGMKRDSVQINAQQLSGDIVIGY